MSVTAVGGWLARKGIPCKGNPLIFHLGIVDDALDVEVGWPLEGAVEGDETVSIRSYPATRAAALEHQGRYEELPALYGPLEDWIRARGLTPGTPVRELYVTNPNDTIDPESWVTRIVWPV